MPVHLIILSRHALIWNYVAKVNEPLELHRFPFDRQIIKLKVEITAQKLLPCTEDVAMPERYQDEPCVPSAWTQLQQLDSVGSSTCP